MGKILKFYSTVIPFVGTLNDNEVACPVSYVDENGVMQDKLEETPEIAKRKERVRYYLRNLGSRFKNDEHLLLEAIFITCNKRNIDATNILDLIQNAGNKVIWNDDGQFIDVRSQRYLSEHNHKELERTIVYVIVLPEIRLWKSSYRLSRNSLLNKDYSGNHSKKACLEKLNSLFNISEFQKFHQNGFWEDARFLQVPTLSANYEKWHMEKSNREAEQDQEICLI